jgi:EAL domain-containing protein (putative c-di-GMP-specific phosphodiesterase class I)/GGDEF domain-containing protein
VSADLHRFMSFAFAGADLLLELDRSKNIAFALGATSGLATGSDAQLVGQSWHALIAEEDHQLVDSLLGSLKPSSRCGPVLVRLAVARDNGMPRNALFSACRLPMAPDAIGCTLSRVSLAAAPHAAARRRDPQTQLIEASAFSEVATTMVESARAYDRELELSFFDLPGLQQLSDKLPPEQSRTLVGRIGALLRAASIDGNAAARLGAGRFGVVHDPAMLAADLARKIESDAVAPDGTRLEVSHSTIDIASSDIPPDSIVRAIRYVVDEVSRNGVDGQVPQDLGKVFEGLVASTLERAREFSRAVSESQFGLMYQPIASLATGRVHHFEVLTRFKGDESPLDTIRFAEEIGVIQRLDLAVMSRAIDNLRRPSADRRVAIAVNISGHSIENGVFVRCLLEMLDEHKVLASRLALEITESAQLKELSETNKVLQEIRRRGFQVCLDDFGAGSASFQYLQALSVDFVKIDGAYTRRLGKSPKDDAMIRGLVRLCDDLKIGTIAEMVETRDQAERLRAIGVTLAQGWYYGKPTLEPNLPWDYDDDKVKLARA